MSTALLSSTSPKSRRNGEDGGAGGLVGELLNVPRVLNRAEALLLRGLGVGVVQVDTLPGADKLLNGLRERGFHRFVE